MDDRFDREILRLAEVMAQAIQAAGTTRQLLERQLGLSSGYLSKILRGGVELRVRHLLVLADALGVTPADLLRLAWPEPAVTDAEQQAHRERTIALLEARLGPKPPTPKPAPDAEHPFDEQVKRALGRLLGLCLTSSEEGV